MRFVPRPRGGAGRGTARDADPARKWLSEHALAGAGAGGDIARVVAMADRAPFRPTSPTGSRAPRPAGSPAGKRPFHWQRGGAERLLRRRAKRACVISRARTRASSICRARSASSAYAGMTETLHRPDRAGADGGAESPCSSRRVARLADELRSVLRAKSKTEDRE